MIPLSVVCLIEKEERTKCRELPLWPQQNNNLMHIHHMVTIPTSESRAKCSPQPPRAKQKKAFRGMNQFDAIEASPESVILRK